ncbi:MAG: uracil-DNA glycosylase [Desulfobacteraceae bacterium]|nr:uracil-DNA glycosylase [Desulfobacteraceae bacterium]
MAIPDPINPVSPAREMLAVIQDFSTYLRYLKKLGHTELIVSSQTLDILASWGQTQTVSKAFYVQGPAAAKVVLVDGSDVFFKGDAGQLLTKILGAMKLSPDAVSICNAPDPTQVQQHVLAVRPEIVITLGELAASMLTDRQTPLETFRGQFFTFQGIAVMPTFHPLQLLGNPALKRPVWDDMQQVMAHLASDHGH